MHLAGSPVFTKIPSGSHVALAGNRLQADCQAVGYPLPYIIWTFEGVVVCEIEGVIVAANGTMIISQVLFIGGATILYRAPRAGPAYPIHYSIILCHE